MKKRFLPVFMALVMSLGIIAPVNAAEKFVRFDILDQLDFETAGTGGNQTGGVSQWIGTKSETDPDEPYIRIENGEGEFAPQSGNAAIYFGGTAPVSLWGGKNGAGTSTPQDGEMIEGTFWIKAMETEPSGDKLPKIRMYYTDPSRPTGQTQVNLAISDTTYNTSTLVPFEWTQLKLESTGNAYAAGFEIGFEIVTDGSKFKCMLDNIEIGAYRDDGSEEPEDPEGKVFKPYGIYELLNFENPSLFTDLNTHNISADRFKTNDSKYPAANGETALYLNGYGWSIWGGGQKVADAEPGATMEGYFMFRVSQPWYDAEKQEEAGGTWFKLPKISVKKESDGKELCYFDPYSDTILNYNPYVWYKIPLTSTGETFTSDDYITYSITPTEGSGFEYMIDDVVFGTYVDKTYETVSVAAAPEVESYTTFNSDFEKIDTSVNFAANWGQYVPNQDKDEGPDGANYIYNTNEAYSGTSMIEVVRGMSMWSIDNKNMLDMANQIIGGSYMLYVSEDCNLNNDYPYVYVSYHVGSDETIVAESPKNNAAYPVRPGWNKIPILPVEGKTIPEDATRVNLMLVSPSVTENGVSNVMYPGKYYVDAINVGEVKKDFYISSDSKVNFTGDTAECDIIITNAKTDETTLGTLGAAVYEDGRLAGVGTVETAAVAARGSKGVESTLVELDVPAKTGDGAISVSVFYWDTLAGMTPICASKDIVEVKNAFPYTDSNIAYIGRWQDKDGYMNSNWGGAYFKTNFTGNSIKLDLAAGADIFVSVDGGADKEYNIAGAGIVDITPEGLSGGEHELRVASKYTFDSIKLKEIILNEGETLSAPTVYDTLIEFIGDSNTAGYLLNGNSQLSNYSWLAGEQLGEHIHIAYTGMALSDGIFNTNINRDIGMSSLFFKPAPMDERDSENWDFTAYTPDIVCMNLGGNDDNTNAVPGGIAKFEETLPVFLSQLRAVYPEAKIVVLIPTTSEPGDAIRALIPGIVEGMGDDAMFWYDAYEWIKDDLAGNQLSDNVHLSDKGQALVAEQLTNIFAGLLYN